MIRFRCANCGKGLGVDDSLAGKTGKCPGCKNPFVVPSGAITAAPPRPGPPPLPATRGAAIQEGPPQRRRPRPVEEDEDEEEEIEKKPRKKKKKKKKRKSSSFSLSPFAMVMIGVLAVGLLFAGLALLSPTLVLVPIGLGLIVSFASGIWFLIVAFSDSPMQGIACLFIPFYNLFYLITHFEETKRPFFLNLVGLGVIVIGFLAGLTAPGGNPFK